MRKSKNLLIIAFLVFAMLAVGCFGGNSDAPEHEYTRGVLTENSFESEFLNLRFVLPEGFNMMSQEDMENTFGFVMDAMFDEEIADYVQEAVIYEMVATAPMGIPSLIVMLEKLPVRDMTIRDHIETMKSDAIEEMISVGMEITFSDEIITVEIAGETYTQVSAVIYMFGIDTNQKYLFRQIGDMMVNIIVAYMPGVETEVQMLMDAFEPF